MVAPAAFRLNRECPIPTPIKALALLAGLGHYIGKASRSVSSVRAREFRALERLDTLYAGSTPPTGRAMHMLVAEDNPVDQRVLVGMREKRGHSVALAVETLARRSFDRALLDVQMPEMSGPEAAAIVGALERESGAAHRLPMAAITANAMKGDREQCLAAAMDDILPSLFIRRSYSP